MHLRLGGPRGHLHRLVGERGGRDDLISHRFLLLAGRRRRHRCVCGSERPGPGRPRVPAAARARSGGVVQGFPDRLADVPVPGDHPRERGGEGGGRGRGRAAGTAKPVPPPLTSSSSGPGARPARGEPARWNSARGYRARVYAGVSGAVACAASRPASSLTRSWSARGIAGCDPVRAGADVRGAAAGQTSAAAGAAARAMAGEEQQAGDGQARTPEGRGRSAPPRRPRRRHRCARARRRGPARGWPRPAGRRSRTAARRRTRPRRTGTRRAPGRRGGRRRRRRPRPRTAPWRRSRARHRNGPGARRPRGPWGRTALVPPRSRRRAWRPQRIATAPLTTPSDSICAVRDTSA